MCEANTILLHDKSPPHQIVKKLAQSFTIKTKRMHWRKEKLRFFRENKIHNPDYTNNCPWSAQNYGGSRFYQETVVCVVFFLFLYSYVYYTSEDCWGGIMEVVAWFMANTFIKNISKLAPPSPHHNLYLIIVEINLFYVQFFLFCSRTEKSKFN